MKHNASSKNRSCLFFDVYRLISIIELYVSCIIQKTTPRETYGPNESLILENLSMSSSRSSDFLSCMQQESPSKNTDVAGDAIFPEAAFPTSNWSMSSESDLSKKISCASLLQLVIQCTWATETKKNLLRHISILVLFRKHHWNKRFLSIALDRQDLPSASTHYI